MLSGPFPPVKMLVTVGIEQLAAALANAAGPVQDPNVVWSFSDLTTKLSKQPPPTPPPLSETLKRMAGRAWIQHAGHPPDQTLADLFARARLQRVLHTGDGAVLAMGRTVRLATPAQKDALIARDVGCVIPGCAVPGEHCEVHHVIPWAAGGPTDVQNMCLLCPRQTPHRSRATNLGPRNDQRRPLGPATELGRPHPTTAPQPHPHDATGVGRPVQGRPPPPPLQPASSQDQVVRVTGPRATPDEAFAPLVGLHAPALVEQCRHVLRQHVVRRVQAMDAARLQVVVHDEQDPTWRDRSHQRALRVVRGCALQRRVLHRHQVVGPQRRLDQPGMDPRHVHGGVTGVPLGPLESDL